MATLRHDWSGLWQEERFQVLRTPLVYHLLLPGLVALLPVLLPFVFIIPSGWHSTYVGAWLPPLAVIAVGAVWAGQVLRAAQDDLGRKVDEGRIDAEHGQRLWLGLTLGVWLLVAILPLRYRATHAWFERARFKATSGAMVGRLNDAVADRQQAWIDDYGMGKAFDPEDERCDPDGFRGPFAPDREALKAKMVIDPRRRVFYILDRPTSIALSPIDAVGGSVAGRLPFTDPATGEPQARFERGLVKVPAQVPPPETTMWGMPMYRLTRVGLGWYWYVAAADLEHGAL